MSPMQTVEITAKSVQEATQQAAEKLGVELSSVKVTILEETKGLFGKSSVRVKAEAVPSETSVPSEPEPVAAPAPAPVEAPVEAAPAPAPTSAPAPSGPLKIRNKKAPAAAPVADTPVTEAIPAVPTPAAEESAPAKGRGRGGKKESVAEPVAAASEEVSEPEAAAEEVVATSEEAEALAALVRELLDSAKLNVSAHVGSIAGKYVNVTLDGKDVAFIVGKHGEVLNALQYLVNIIASRRVERGIRVTLDGNDYRRRREEALTQLAQKIAEQVKERGEEAVLDALPAFERRIVHKALGEIDGITTYSEGEEPNRRVVIAPID